MNIVTEIIELLSIVLLILGISILYGLISNSIFSIICPQFFTRGYLGGISNMWRNGLVKRLARDENNPLLPALVWSLLGSPMMAMIIGVPMALCSRIGTNQMSYYHLYWIIFVVTLTLAWISTLVGICSYYRYKDTPKARTPIYFDGESFDRGISRSQLLNYHSVFIANATVNVIGPIVGLCTSLYIIYLRSVYEFRSGN